MPSAPSINLPRSKGHSRLSTVACKSVYLQVNGSRLVISNSNQIVELICRYRE